MQTLKDHIGENRKRGDIDKFAQEWAVNRRKVYRLLHEHYCVVIDGAIYKRELIKPRFPCSE